MKYFTQSQSEIRNFKKAPMHQLSTILASCVGAAASLLLAVNAHAGVIFQDNFDSAPTGATRTLVTAAGVTNSIASTNPLGASDGAYLNSTVSGTGGKSIVTYTPTSAASSWAALQGADTVVGANSFMTLNGGFDLFVRPNISSSTTDDNWFRVLDLSAINGTTGTGIRLVLGANGGNPGLKEEFITSGVNGNKIQAADSGVGNKAGGAFNISTGFDTTRLQAVTANNSSLFVDGQVTHLAYTFSTNPTTGMITLKTYAQAGTGALDTATLTPLSTINIYVNGTGVGSNALSSGSWTIQENPIIANNNVDYDTIRLYDTAAPTVFAGVPEPTTVGLVSGGLLLLGLSRKKFLGSK